MFLNQLQNRRLKNNQVLPQLHLANKEYLEAEARGHLKYLAQELL